MLKKSIFIMFVLIFACILFSGCNQKDPDKVVLVPYEVVLNETSKIEQPIAIPEEEQVNLNVFKNVSMFNEWWQSNELTDSPLEIEGSEHIVFVFEIYESEFCDVHLNSMDLGADRKSIFITLQEKITDDYNCPTVFDKQKTLVVSVERGDITDVTQFVVRTRKTHTFTQDIQS
ncbi:hypothetical protein [Bacillus horti]|uniref:Lipoprotein n=1 Tax=Caldalkalibacillus horti TaxID=77523 RepID=A0ABT9W5N8_9BACI|nr:hypothetical protein [Bacillus horti]MDQ0168551.1 hypothetical protein [Bacillus horti]